MPLLNTSGINRLVSRLFGLSDSSKTTNDFYAVAVLLATSIFLQSFSFLSIKFATQQHGLATLALMGLAFVFLGSRAILWQWLLARRPLSFIYPFASLVQILILLYAIFLFGENVGLHQFFGFVIMIIGLVVISLDHKQ